MANEGNFMEDRKSRPNHCEKLLNRLSLMTAGPKLCYKMTDDGDVLVNVTTSDAPQMSAAIHI